MNFIKNTFTGIAMVAAVAIFSSCKDDYISVGSDIVPEGESAVLTFSVADPDEMSDMTRTVAGIDPKSSTAKTLKDLWIGVFKKSGYLINYQYYNEADFASLPQSEGQIKIKDLKVVSGECYIVAVGNVSSRKAITSDNANETTLESKLRNNNLTWSEFTKLGVTVDGSQDPVRLTPLVMSGIYTASGDGITMPYPTVTIQPGKNELKGSVKLRRLDSYVKFKLTVAENIEFTPYSWQLFNVPLMSYLLERTDLDDVPNLTDEMWVKNNPLSYGNTPEYESSFFENEYKANSDESHIPDGYSFDFYQLENRHTGIISSDPENGEYYSLREEEFKQNELNTGFYRSLVSSASDSKNYPMANNNASYVVIKGELKYYYDDTKEKSDGSKDYSPVAFEESKKDDLVSRTAEVTYTIHLGYIEGENDKDRANDFNCRRNTHYTYNVTIQGVDRIRVEAEKNGELSPGLEGIVTDIKSEEYHVDAHYITFNIQLSNKERDELQFDIDAYYKNIKVGEINTSTIEEWKSGKYEGIDKTKFWKWISFIPTSNKETLVPYPGDPGSFVATDNNKEKQRKMFYLDNIRNLNDYPDFNGNKNINDETEKWYTVYIDEYVYENGADETGGNWVNYVDNPDRKVWLRVTAAESPDKESQYKIAKYIISQRSIQTFYDPQISHDNNIDALGLEHVNESFGLNLRTIGVENPDAFYGRKNIFNFLGMLDGDNLKDNPEVEWDYYLNLSSQQIIYSTKKPELNNLIINEHKENVPAIKSITELYNENALNYKLDYTSNNYDPQMGKEDMTIEAMTACLNRNRDLNGNGFIDPDEIRWFIPTSNQMVDFCMARSSLKTPLFNYNDTPQLEGRRGGSLAGRYTRYRFAGSNNRLIWAEQGMSSSDFLTSGSGNNAAPWEVRCTRLLGTKLNVISKISPAYEKKKFTENGMEYLAFIPTYYDKNMLRDPVSSLDPHSGTKYQNRLCKYGFIIQPKRTYLKKYKDSPENFFISYKEMYSETDVNSSSAPDLNSNEENKSKLLKMHDAWVYEANSLAKEQYGEGWRVPNQKEVALMKILDKIDQDEGEAYISCTYKEYGMLSGVRGVDNTGYYFGVQIPSKNVNQPINVICYTLDLDGYVRCVRDLTEAEYNSIKNSENIEDLQ